MGNDDIYWAAMGFFVGYMVFSDDVKQAPMQPTEVVREDRNSDNLVDIVQEFKDGSETILYAYRTENGGINYRLGGTKIK